MTYKVIVAGGRDFNDYQLLKRKLSILLDNRRDVEIVSGAARGADSLGERYAEENGLSIHRKPADWDTYGKSAGYRRNAEMAEYADALVAFWDGKSRGTKHMIDLAEKHDLAIRIIKY